MRKQAAAPLAFGYELEKSGPFPPSTFSPSEKALYRKLMSWAVKEATKHGQSTNPTYYVMQRKTAAAVVMAETANALVVRSDLISCYGIGKKKVREFGNDILWIVKESR
jgi:hypothetical protein